MIPSVTAALLTAFAVLCSATASPAPVSPTPVSSETVGGDERDTIVLKKNKKKLRGRVILELDDRVSLLVGTRRRWIQRKDILSIDSVFRSLTSVIQKFDAAPDTPKAMLELADMCEKAQLKHEAALFYWSTLFLDPKNVRAHEALSHRMFGKEWRLQAEGAWRSLKQTEKIRADWGKAWRLRSEHFELRTDTGVRRAVRTLLELEGYYRHLFELFQRPLELLEVTEPVQVHMYRDADAFPRLSNNVDAYFSIADNILFTFLDDAGRPLTLFHQATHATIYNLGGSNRGRRTELPGWLNEGWADYMEGVLAPAKNGRLKLDLNRRVGYRIGNLRAEPKPFGLTRVLNLRETDFSASSRQKLKYAQSYALMLLMMEGDNGKYTTRFLAYMKEALAGKASASAFRKVFRKDLKKIEKDHLGMK